jgi:hypothetical protein
VGLTDLAFVGLGVVHQGFAVVGAAVVGLAVVVVGAAVAAGLAVVGDAVGLPVERARGNTDAEEYCLANYYSTELVHT